MEKQYNSQQAESQAQQKWAQERTYETQKSSGAFYSIDTPPPTVSGSLHIGHIFSYTQTDIVARYKRLNGFAVYYPFGFDDNGLPTERYVEKKREVSSFKMGRSEFIKLCLQETHEVEQQFIKLWQRMGFSVNWDYCYSTISDLVRKISQESFIELYKKGFIFRKYEPALFCTTCRTSVSQAELDDAQKPSFFNDIAFKDEHGNDLIIGTTRPELLPSCVALIFNPNDERYQHLKDKKAIVPIFGQHVPILEDEKVDIEKGTGLVMCCTFGDKTDIEWYKKFKLPYRQSIGFDGKFLPDTGILAGLKPPEAREKVLEELRKENLLLRQTAIMHTVNVHERCKKEIEFLALEQWFVNILDHKKKFLELADQIKWYPAFMKSRYVDWVSNLSWDWCISRQRFFGIPFPAWHCKNCKSIILADVKDLPIDPQETPYQGNCPHCGKSEIEPDTDVMDTWNTSSLTPYICAALFTPPTSLNEIRAEARMKMNGSIFSDPKISEFIPMSMRPQAHDIIRTWAFDTIVKVWMHQDDIPWENIVISGHVLADSKEKLSKSKENAPFAPENLLKNYPADAIRYWTASGSLGHDIAFSEAQLKIGLKLITKLWNAFRFVGEHISTIDPQKVPHKFEIENEWILHSTTNAFATYQKHFEDYEFGLALLKIEHFFWSDFCDNYLEVIKNQLFNPQDYDEEHVYATRWTLYQVGLRILQMYAPYLPHLTETIYDSLYKKQHTIESIHVTKFANVQVEYVFESSAGTMIQAIKVIDVIRKLKSENQLSLKVPIQTLTIYSEQAATLDQLKVVEQLLRGITQAQEIRYKQGAIENSLIQEGELWHAKVAC